MTLPDPMTPADCDLRGLPYMPVEGARLIDSDTYAISTGDEFKAALTLWFRAWQQVPAGSLPNNERVLAHLSCAGLNWATVRDMALRGFVLCSDGRLYHPVIAAKALEAWAHRTAQRAKANGRWERERAKAQPDPGPGAGDAAALPGECRGISSGIAAFQNPAMQVKGELSKKEDSAVPADAVPAPIPTARDRLWSEGLPIVVTATGLGAKPARALLGRWLKAARDDCGRVLAVLLEAQRKRPIDPVPWVTAALAQRTAPVSKLESQLDALGVPDVWAAAADDGAVVPFPSQRRIAG